jgi:dTDP-glucose 4,6-dehydratase
MKYAVIGSNSFSGAHFVDFLLEQKEVSSVIGISRSKEYVREFLPYRYKKDPGSMFQFHGVDLNKDNEKICALLDEYRPDYVVNFAAQGEVRNSWKWPEQWFQTNAMGILQLTNHLAQKHKLKKYVAISTPEVYGATGPDIKESHNYHPSTPYAASKLAGDAFLFALNKHYSFPVSFTRAANVYGPHQQLFRIIPKTMIQILSGKKLDLHGHGRSVRSFIHMQDVAKATYLVATDGKPGEVYHIAPQGEGYKIADVVAMICRMMGKKFEDSVNLMSENFGQDAMYSLNSEKIRKELNWSNQISLEQGINETLTWIQDNWDFIKTQPADYIHKS